MKAGLRIAVALGVAITAAAVACGFPDVGFAPDDGPETGVPGAEAALDPGTADSSLDTAPPKKPDVDPTGKDKDASSYDGASKVDAAGCVTCDCDGDGFATRAGACDGGPGPVFDCDDTDRGINPDIDFVDTSAWPSVTATKTYDWNCDGVVTKQYTYDLDCNALMLGADCSKQQGFTTDVGCGQIGTYMTCKQGLLGLLGCAPGATQQRKQACK